MPKKVCRETKEFRFSWEGKNFTAGMSVGVVSIGPETLSAQKALSEADAACYVAKDMGRNRVHVYRDFDEAVARRQGEMRWVSEIQAAMEENRLNLNFQTIRQMDHKYGMQNHFEILLRMTDSDGRQIAPGSFIPAAERYNLMGLLDRWVIKTPLRGSLKILTGLSGLAYVQLISPASLWVMAIYMNLLLKNAGDTNCRPKKYVLKSRKPPQ